MTRPPPLRSFWIVWLLLNPTSTTCLSIATTTVGVTSLERRRTRRSHTRTRRFMNFKRSYLPDENGEDDLRTETDMPSTVITSKTRIVAETFTSSNCIVVDGDLRIALLQCDDKVQVGQTGVVSGKIISDSLVTVDGQVEGSVECVTLIVGPAGIVTGDVTCKDLIIRPGGKIGGQLSCETMKSERDVFHQTKDPLEQVVYRGTKQNASSRDNVVAALRAVSDGATMEPPQTSSASDKKKSNLFTKTSNTKLQRTDSGKIEGASSSVDYAQPSSSTAEQQKEALQKNRDAIMATRSFLEKALKRPKPLPEWAEHVKQASRVPPRRNTDQERRNSIENLLSRNNIEFKKKIEEAVVEDPAQLDRELKQESLVSADFIQAKLLQQQQREQAIEQESLLYQDDEEMVYDEDEMFYDAEDEFVEFKELPDCLMEIQQRKEWRMEEEGEEYYDEMQDDIVVDDDIPDYETASFNDIPDYLQMPYDYAVEDEDDDIIPDFLR